ncbi:olfactory receptor 4P4-like [Monodelphis domestica]|uniref:olfactory receptor 4P4-like n=1 Tax=Monodelphis domestica TaxID=13616 RepID=UPI0024E19FEC|nr:olfactory receptor 4P4-like [Monodelphis domestica]
MEIHNNVTEFILLGLLMKEEMKTLCFVIFMACYLAILLGNFIIFITITYSHLMQQPMYYFLWHLSYMDPCFTSTTVPRLISDLVATRNTISYNSCMTQLFTFHLLGGVEMFILVSMAFDRYVAICKPLHYMIIVNRQRCNMLILLAWVVAFWHSVAQLFMILRLPFCGPNQIDHYVCDSKPLLKLACTDTHIASILVIANTGMVVLATFLVLVASYIIILYNLRKHSSEGRRKALSTCASHVMVVLLFFVPCISTYILPPRFLNSDKEFSVFYAVIAPMLNPLIYTFRNAEMKNAMWKVWSRKLAWLFK